jgi:hypothetical protein
MEVSDQFHDPVTVPTGKNPRYPLDKSLGVPQSRSGRDGDGKKFLPPCWESNPGRPVSVTTDFNLEYTNMKTNMVCNITQNAC